MAALVAVMIMVSIGTFNWARFATCANTPKLQRGNAGHRRGDGRHA
jgi:MFS superfamily sulfate permease-like transporter